jgi:DNA repair protein RecO (recombination protein O)
MPAITDKAICIRRWDYSETSLTVSLFLRNHGVVRGMAKGAKRPRGGFEGGIDLLTLGQVAAIITPARDLATVTQWRVLDTFRALREHLGANRAGIYMADLIHQMLTEHDPHPRLFDALQAALSGLDDLRRVEQTLLRFEWMVLLETGFRPQLDRDAETGGELPSSTETLGFSPTAGGIVADTGGPDRWRVRRETIDLLRAIAAGEPTDGADATGHGRAARLLAVYIRELLGAEPNSMRWAFPDLRI